MLKKNLLNLFLLTFSVILILLVYTSAPKDDSLDRLTSIDPEAVTRITILHNNKENQLEKKLLDNRPVWEFTRPVAIRANSFRLQSVLALLQAPVHARYSLAEVNPDQIGLKQPETSITFDNLTIHFGIVNPVNNLRYVNIDDNIYLIEDIYSPLLTSGFTTLVALELLPDHPALRKLELLNQTITKNKQGYWHSSLSTSADDINKILQNWQSYQAFGVHNYLDRPSLGEVRVYLESSEKPVIFKITDTDPWLILARPDIGIEYHLDAEAYNLLVNPIICCE